MFRSDKAASDLHDALAETVTSDHGTASGGSVDGCGEVDGGKGLRCSMPAPRRVHQWYATASLAAAAVVKKGGGDDGGWVKQSAARSCCKRAFFVSLDGL